ncbi:aminopeptidase P family protein [Halosquirtibacter xylanolyticus]|uniref:aminopeptidase P family protein n=1 Tax=Halosquirtibacter xylanolyticus TaxID=3374599 RepID=UPI003749BEFC|nr:aminopeptidase P family protein [Prolixibacteraceae bacterium]
MFSKDTYISRRERLHAMMPEKGLVLVPGNMEAEYNYPHNTYHFRQDSTFVYLFGLDLPNMFGVIDLDEGKDYIFGNDVDIEDIIWMGPQIPLKEKALEFGINHTAPFNNLYNKVKEAMESGRKIHILPTYRARIELLLGDILDVHPKNLHQFISPALRTCMIKLREKKDADEIREIEKACAIGYEMHTTAMKMAHAGNKEQDIAGLIEGISLRKGKGVSFPCILSQHGETLHNHDHSGTLETGKLMLVDAGAEANSYYASDFTRTIPVGGRFSAKQKDVYNIVLAANEKAKSMFAPGITNLDCHLAAARVIAEGLKDIGIMKGNMDDAVAKGAHAMFFPHGLGHMMGLDVHDMEGYGQIYVGYDEKIRPVDQFGTENLRLGKKLEEGFVITNEPGVYFIPALIEKWKSEKINNEYINFDLLENEYLDFGGIRLEDDLLITKSGCEIIGQRVPITVEEVENEVQKGL